MKLALTFAALALPALGAEIAVLHSGFRLRADRIECGGGRCILSVDGGQVELERSEIDFIEPDDTPPPALPAPAAAAGNTAPKSARQLVTEAALRNGLPPEIVHSVAVVESAYRADAISPKGAVGVMQLMPDTARELNVNPRDPAQNIDAGTRLLRELLIKYENEPSPVRRALAAYNAGEGAVEKYNGVPPYRETQQYVEKVIEQYWKLKSDLSGSR
jgi:soluble lytic murein transglycosylase-like protein